MSIARAAQPVARNRSIAAAQPPISAVGQVPRCPTASRRGVFPAPFAASAVDAQSICRAVSERSVDRRAS